MDPLHNILLRPFKYSHCNLDGTIPHYSQNYLSNEVTSATPPQLLTRPKSIPKQRKQKGMALTLWWEETMASLSVYNKILDIGYQVLVLQEEKGISRLSKDMVYPLLNTSSYQSNHSISLRTATILYSRYQNPMWQSHVFSDAISPVSRNLSCIPDSEMLGVGVGLDVCGSVSS